MSSTIHDDPTQTTNNHVKVLADGKVMKVQKTRQRKILSCIYCHSKKIKCSRVQPVCNNCTKLGLECKYFVNERVSRGGKKKNTPSINGTSISSTFSADTACAEDATSGSVPSNYDNPAVLSLASPDTSPPLSPLSKELPDKFFGSGLFAEVKSEGIDLPNQANLLNGPFGSNALTGNLERSTNSGEVRNINKSSSEMDTNILQTGSIIKQKSYLHHSGVPSTQNITNNYFNSPFTSSEDAYAFNMSSFAFAGENVQSPITFPNFLGSGTPPSQTPNITTSTINTLMKKKDTIQQQQQQQQQQQKQQQKQQLQQQGVHPTIHNSLSGFPSNPETTINYLYGTNTNYNNKQLLDQLSKSMPRTRERLHELVDRYVNLVHILLPIMCNLEDFIIEHAKFWDRRTRHHLPDSPSGLLLLLLGNTIHQPEDLQFFTLYFPVLYAATISEFEEYDNLLLNEDINMYLKAFNMICQYYNYPHGLKTIPLLLGNVMIQLTLPNPLTMEMLQIIRYAKFLHMHKDPTLTLRITDWKVVKFRRMLWWTIFGLDALTSHNFCLQPVCKYEDFNVLMPSEMEPVSDGNGDQQRLNIGVLSLRVKFKYDRILSDLVYQLHGVTSDITPEDTNLIKTKIEDLFEYVHDAMDKIADNYRLHPPASVQEMNLVNFIKNHSWSYVDRALMLLHKKILMGSGGTKNNERKSSFVKMGDVGSSGKSSSSSPNEDTAIIHSHKTPGLSLSQYEDTFALLMESNIIANFDRLTILQLKFLQNNNFTYENLHNNLIPLILHNLNDFLKYNDFIKFGKYNWYVKRTIPLDLIILMFIVITVKFKYEFMTVLELSIYVKLINKALFILNRKWFKNEKYKRMLLLANLTWEFMLKKYNIINIINLLTELQNGAKMEFFDYQVTGYLNMSELFNVMDVPQPMSKKVRHQLTRDAHEDHNRELTNNNALVLMKLYETNQVRETELLQMKEKIYYDLRNNFVDINDYCAFYTLLEDILRELMDYISN